MPGVRRDASALAAKTMQAAQGMLGLEAGELAGRSWGQVQGAGEGAGAIRESR